MIRQEPYVFEIRTERRAKDNSEESQPAQAVANVFWKSEERLLDERNPDSFDGMRDD